MKPKYLHVFAKVRYFEDAWVNDVRDDEIRLMPFIKDEVWQPVIDIEKGLIIDWPPNINSDIHYKVCDEGRYTITDEYGNILFSIDGYVPKTMSPKEPGFGDYIIMDVNEEGYIKNWMFNLNDFK